MLTVKLNFLILENKNLNLGEQIPSIKEQFKVQKSSRNLKK